MDFNYTMTGRRDPTYLGVVFDIAKAQQQKPAIQKLTKEGISFLDNAFCPSLHILFNISI
jgi:hypothetical protein